MSEMKVFAVGDLDFVAAHNEAEALQVMIEMVGEDVFEPGDVYEVVGSLLDTHWHDEDAPGVSIGTLRDFLAKADKPEWLAGTED